MLPYVVVARRKPTQFLFTAIFPFFKTSHLRLLLLLRSFHHKHITKEQEKPNDSSLTVSYLINTCGLSPHSALSASKIINIKNTEKPDFNLALFKSHGFSDTQITKLISIYPPLLLCKWDKSIKPKFDYLLSVGYSDADLPTLVSSNPLMLKASLQRKLKSNFDLLRPIFVSSQQLSAAVRRSSAWLFTINLEANFLPNVRILQSYGVPAPNIAKLAAMDPRTVQTTTARFKTTVELVRKMGFDPLSTMFVYGISVMAGMNPSTWERKVTFYKSLGWSEADLISAFKKQPSFMRPSEEKTKRVMDFAVEKMNWAPSFIAAHPVLLCMSLEKRIIPRCSVMRVLESKRLGVRSSVIHFLSLSENDFLNKYVMKYQDQVPELLQAYKGNLESVEP